ncbi:(d)CMP kinase [Deinococcus sp. Marseille-Q6407]|uniref:(d)CMP kinase n=1 Tax=Deinococcus sp. Marseille-Q6407 TaxID=2969223 RepID=UPI0021C2019A|nr:(d)CMP kinase [Deinococcus sp. Marseille-Q6407]
MIITIDGVAASGKSTVASGVARTLGIPYISSGLLYRAVTLCGLEAALEGGDLRVLEHLQAQPPRLDPRAEGNRVWRGERELTEALHATRVDEGVSAYAALPEVRAWVDEQLRALPAPFVAEGRDMGTNVFPQAQAKFYLTAHPRVRAQRRSAERPEELDAIEAALVERDARDAAQSAPAADALMIDTGELSAQQVIDRIVAEVESRRARA